MKRKLGIFALATLTALGAGLVPVPAQAGHGNKHKKHPSVHRFRGGNGPHAVHRGFVVPRRIHPAAHRTYRPYYQDRVYFRPHRHYHAVYYFPVRTRVGMIWQPHYYCDGNRFVGQVDYHGPRVSLHVRF